MTHKQFALARILAAVVLFSPFIAGAQEDILKTLKPQHPRLLADRGTWEKIKTEAAGDPELALVLRRIEADGRMLLDKPPVAYKKDGKRLLAVSRESLNRITTLAFAYRMTGDAAFARRAEAEMLAVSAFKDWNPSHFLDTAEMSAAVSLGYDWLYDAMPDASRQLIRDALVQKGVVIAAAESEKGWKSRENNWNQVCFGGTVMAALAVAEDAPVPAAKLLAQARVDNKYGMKPCLPDGIYPEGPGYWSYGTSFELFLISSLQSALGTDWNLTSSPGFLKSADAIQELTGPTGQAFNFSDGGERLGVQPALFWFAGKLNKPELVQNQFHLLKAVLENTKEPFYKQVGISPAFLALWWTAKPATEVHTLPLNWTGDGENPIAVFRSAWADSNAMYLGMKAGTASSSHGHMDAGSFIFEAEGVRWAIDIGRQDYLSLESKNVDLWNGRQDGQRWQVFRLNDRSHNTLVIDDQLHRVNGRAVFAKFSPDAFVPSAEMDLSPVFAGQASQVTRTFSLDAAKREVVIADKLAGLNPGADVRWAMVTRAKGEISGGHAVLRQGGKTLEMDITSPEKTSFQFIAADPPKDGFNAPNPNTHIVVAHCKAPASGELSITVRLHSVAGIH